jgi:Domain of unknown function (DUF4395)
MSDAQVNFVKQQGFEGASARTCAYQYPALMFQPRVIGVLVLAGVLLQAAPLFLTLSAVLWWSVLMPRLNPFDKLYNGLVAARKGLPPLTAAPNPRRFAQGMAATFMLLIGVSLLAGRQTVAWVLEAFLLVALRSDLRRVLSRFLCVPSPHRKPHVRSANPALGPGCVRCPQDTEAMRHLRGPAALEGDCPIGAARGGRRGESIAEPRADPGRSWPRSRRPSARVQPDYVRRRPEGDEGSQSPMKLEK